MSTALQSRLNAYQQKLFWMGLMALASCGAGAFLSRKQFFLSYLSAYLFWFGLGIGAVGFLMLSHLTGGHWGQVLRRFLEASAGTLPLLALLFLPLLLGLGHLYPWTHLQTEPHGSSSSYFNIPWFIVRTVLFFMIWIVMALLLRRWSQQQDQTREAEPTRKLRKLSGPGLVVFFLTVSFAGIDWIMSLETHWHSSIFALIILVSQGLSAFALSLILLTRFRGEEYFVPRLDARLFNQLGNILLALVLLWAYLSFSQLLIIYSGNLPAEITWYLHRINGGWIWVSIALASLQFLVPFVLLLFRSIKVKPERLVWLAGLLLCMQFIHVLWLVRPSVAPHQFFLSWMDFVALVGIGGVWSALFLRQLKGVPLIPQNDPREGL